MLDIKFIVENKDIIKMGAKKKRIAVDVDRLVELDAKRRDLKPDDATFPDVIREWRMLMLDIPNIPDISVPEGDTPADNKEIRRWSQNDPEDGEPAKLSFVAKSYLDIMRSLDMIDTERGAKVSNLAGYFLKNDGVTLSNALQQYAQQFFAKKGFVFMQVPTFARRETLFGTGYLPQYEERLYKTQDGEYIASTPEVPMMGYHMNEVLDATTLSKQYLAYASVYHRAARENVDLWNPQDAETMQQIVLCEASHQRSVEWHEDLTQNFEGLLESLGIAHRVVLSCGGDLGLGQVKKYTIEVWAPSEKCYRAIGTSSYFHDFQTRRLNIRYKDDKGMIRFAHSISATGFSVPQMLAALVENIQQEDSTILVPEVLRSLIPHDGTEEDN